MKNRSKLLNDLILSLENEGLQVDPVTEADLAKATQEISEAQASLESYQIAYNLIADMHSNDTISLESYSAVMNLTLSNVSISMESDEWKASDKFQEDALNKWRAGQSGSDSDKKEAKDSLLKVAKDKVIAAFKWLMEKIGNLFRRVRDFMSNAFSKMGKNSRKVAEWFKEATGFKKDVHVPVDDVYLIVKNNSGFYSASEIKGAVENLYIDIPEACADFIESAVKQIPTEAMHYNEKSAPDLIKKVFTEKAKRSFGKALSGKRIISKDGAIEKEFLKIDGANVGVSGGFVTAINGKEIDEDIVGGRLEFDKKYLKIINPNISVDVISVTTRDFNKLQDLAEMLEDEVERYQKEFESQKLNKINKALEGLRDELINVLIQKSFNKEGAEERASEATQRLITSLITRTLNGAFIVRAQSEQAAIQVLNCTNKLLWRVYKVEADEMSDSKDVAIV